MNTQTTTVGYSGKWAIRHDAEGYFGEQINTRRQTDHADTYELALEDVHAEQRREDAEAARELKRAEAELFVLDDFNRRRAVKGHDYGSGQRGNELMRRRREMRDLGGQEYPTLESVDMDELNLAVERLLRPRLRRIEREDYRRSTAATKRTLAVLREMFADLERRLERIRRRQPALG